MNSNELKYTGGKLLAIFDANKVVEITGSESSSVIFTDDDTLDFSDPNSIARDSSGNIYISEFMGLKPKIYKIDNNADGTVFNDELDDKYTGLGEVDLYSNGDLVFAQNNKLLKIASGTTTAVDLFTGLNDSLIQYYDDNTGFPSGVYEDTKIVKFESEFDIDENDNIYIGAKLEYAYDESGYQTFSQQYIVKVSSSGEITVLKELEYYSINDLNWYDGHLYYILIIKEENHSLTYTIEVI